MMPRKPLGQVPGIYHRAIGDIIVTAVSDGYADAGIEPLRNIDPSDALLLFEEKLRPVRRASINCYLVYSEGRLALIDTGCGPYFGPTAGQLLRNLSAIGIEGEDIDAILLTHIHPDHSAGLTDLAGGRRIFANAKLVVHRNELIHWFDDVEMAKVSDQDRRFFFDTAREQVTPYKDVVQSFEDQTEVFPGVMSRPLPGHTPGHSGFVISSKGEELLIWGDTVHIPEVQIFRPDVTLTFDCDQALAAKTREKVFEEASSRKLLVAGSHLDFPGFSHIVQRRDGYHLLPEPWSYTMR
ncbi:MBL fold metallo-hydrolase [Azospirillum sp. A26]|uniref:MBL fold metallo-hydrolase n=1 Tax=Azospirillum sp. A26 TaxID=3160607 RepID=UPI00366F8EE2